MSTESLEGKREVHVLALLCEFRMPIITTLHTILETPGPAQKLVMDELIQFSERIVVISRDSWIFGPEAPYEREGDVGNVAFPCGFTIGPDGDTISLYYGGADTSIALATGSIRGLLRWLDTNGRLCQGAEANASPRGA